jgi:hypothetical protein
MSLGVRHSFGGVVLGVALLVGCTSASEPVADPSGAASATPSGSPSGSPSASPSATASEAAVIEGSLVTRTAALVGTWRAIELYGNTVAELRLGRKKLDLGFGKDRGKWTWGSTDLCNSMGGRFTVDGDGAFDAKPGYSTAALCVPGSKPGELNIEAINSADQAWLGEGGERLTLSVNGEPVAVYLRQYAY